jgi:hypothetical protein
MQKQQRRPIALFNKVVGATCSIDESTRRWRGWFEVEHQRWSSALIGPFG